MVSCGIWYSIFSSLLFMIEVIVLLTIVVVAVLRLLSCFSCNYFFSIKYDWVMFFFQRSTPWLVRPTPFERQRSLRGPDSARLDRQRFDSDFQDGRRDLRAPFADGLFTIQSRLRVRSLHKRRRCYQGCGETWQLWDQVLKFMLTQSFDMLDVLALYYRNKIHFVLNYFSLQLKRTFLSIKIKLLFQAESSTWRDAFRRQSQTVHQFRSGRRYRSRRSGIGHFWLHFLMS